MRLIVPNEAKAELKFELIGPGGEVLADAKTSLLVKAVPETTLPFQTNEANPELTSSSKLQQLGADAVEATGNTTRDHPTTKKGNSISWTALVFVNLRERPTASAPVIGVVSKGARIDVNGRKHGWLQVTMPETSESGWVYARYVKPVTGFRGPTRIKNRVISSKSPSDSDSGWPNWAQWLINP